LRAAVRGRLKVVDLPGESVLGAQQIVRDMPHLSMLEACAAARIWTCLESAFYPIDT